MHSRLNKQHNNININKEKYLKSLHNTLQTHRCIKIKNTFIYFLFFKVHSINNLINLNYFLILLFYILYQSIQHRNCLCKHTNCGRESLFLDKPKSSIKGINKINLQKFEKQNELILILYLLSSKMRLKKSKRNRHLAQFKIKINQYCNAYQCSKLKFQTNLMELLAIEPKLMEKDIHSNFFISQAVVIEFRLVKFVICYCCLIVIKSLRQIQYPFILFYLLYHYYWYHLNSTINLALFSKKLFFQVHKSSYQMLTLKDFCICDWLRQVFFLLKFLSNLKKTSHIEGRILHQLNSSQILC
ncbi:transmembrane protein, putative (macronuclear) [Tetrahymena thermophila SB210]|uniref:Transmembrane protein, putative n=1 Tax=Tetrahymena thermophila (strain SB210) TaxID=312017 RepID=W7X9A5_TETTS|nr:transmembrane protein, putative [Tetrahymena thermophila SB210]EWS73932.1 transmembrane protein, putative [Tetrahymena thermophila SB210]|eukprot:XP_012653554.1 transmembrane protein, putative [Tetrahymena thermophila SB210]